MFKESEILPGTIDEKENLLKNSFLEHIKIIPYGERIKICIQCGTCTASCPVSYAMDITPRKLIALFRSGNIESILKSRTIWICASCYTCQTRCPSQIKVTDIIYAIKRTAIERKILNKNIPTYYLSQSFIKSIYKYGRLNEPILIIKFIIKTGFWKFFNLIPLGIHMLKKNRITFSIERIKGIEDLRKIILKAEQYDMPIEKEIIPYVKEAVGYKAIS